MLRIVFFLVCFLMSNTHLQAMTQPEQQEESKPSDSASREDTCFCNSSLSDTSKKNITFTCTTRNKTLQMHEICLRQWLLAKKAPICPLCAEHTITTPYRHEDGDWDPDFWELIEKYKTIFPALTLGFIVQKLLIR